MLRWNHLPELADTLAIAAEAVDTKPYRRAAASLNIDCPPDDLPPMRLRNGWFDPKSPEAFKSVAAWAVEQRAGVTG